MLRGSIKRGRPRSSSSSVANVAAQTELLHAGQSQASINRGPSWKAIQAKVDAAKVAFTRLSSVREQLDLVESTMSAAMDGTDLRTVSASNCLQVNGAAGAVNALRREQAELYNVIDMSYRQILDDIGGRVNDLSARDIPALDPISKPILADPEIEPDIDVVATPTPPTPSLVGVAGPVPVPSEPVPVPSEPVPVPSEPVPVSPEPVPVSPESVPVPSEPVPVSPEPAPVSPEPAPVPPEPVPVPSEPVPVPSQPVPVPSQPVLASKSVSVPSVNPAPVQSQPVPVPSQPVPVSPEPVPVPSHPAPVPSVNPASASSKPESQSQPQKSVLERALSPERLSKSVVKAISNPAIETERLQAVIQTLIDKIGGIERLLALHSAGIVDALGKEPKCVRSVKCQLSWAQMVSDGLRSLQKVDPVSDDKLSKIFEVIDCILRFTDPKPGEDSVTKPGKAFVKHGGLQLTLSKRGKPFAANCLFNGLTCAGNELPQTFDRAKICKKFVRAIGNLSVEDVGFGDFVIGAARMFFQVCKGLGDDVSGHAAEAQSAILKRRLNKFSEYCEHTDEYDDLTKKE